MVPKSGLSGVVMKNLILVSLIMGLAACSEINTESAKFSVQKVNESDSITSSKPYCEVDFVDYELDNKLVAFEMTGKGNLSFGFNLLSGFFRAIGLSFSTESGQMIMSMHLDETLQKSNSLVDVMGFGKMSGSEFRLQLDAVQLGIDAGYYYRTPVSKLTERTLKDSLKNLSSDLQKIETTWTTKVVSILSDNEVIVPTGSVAGLRLGDTFKVYNMEYLWKGKACASELLIARKASQEPIAELQIIQLEKNASVLAVVQRYSDVKIEEGARLEVLNLVKANKKDVRQLKRSVRLRDISSGKIKIQNDKEVDLSAYVNEQLQSLLHDYNLYPRK